MRLSKPSTPASELSFPTPAVPSPWLTPGNGSRRGGSITTPNGLVCRDRGIVRVDGGRSTPQIPGEVIPPGVKIQRPEVHRALERSVCATPMHASASARYRPRITSATQGVHEAAFEHLSSLSA